MCEKNVTEILAENFRNIRQQKNISLKDLSKKLNLDIDMLENFEQGKATTLWLPDHIKIASALGVSYKEFTKGIVFVD